MTQDLHCNDYIQEKTFSYGVDLKYEGIIK